LSRTSVSTRTEWNQRRLKRYQSKNPHLFDDTHRAIDPDSLRSTSKSLAGTSQEAHPVGVTHAITQDYMSRYMPPEYRRKLIFLITMTNRMVAYIPIQWSRKVSLCVKATSCRLSLFLSLCVFLRWPAWWIFFSGNLPQSYVLSDFTSYTVMWLNKILILLPQ